VIAGLLMVVGGAAAGVFGSLLGLGGGILIVPLLTLGFGLPVRDAVGTSLVCVIVTSSAAAGAYLRGGVANLRLGMVLALFTAAGAVIGGLIAFLVPDRALAGLFALLLVWTAVTMARASRRQQAAPAPTPGAASAPASARATVTPIASPPIVLPPVEERAGPLDAPGYRVRRLGPASAVSVGGGVMAALLGVGGGIVNVPTMHVIMGVPVRVAAATSNLIIGVTAVSSAIVYLVRDGIDPYVTGPTALGVFAGATVGARLAPRVDQQVLRWLFVAVLGFTALQMARRAVAG
jgi:uncharacterized membrane protein YfcA